MDRSLSRKLAHAFFRHAAYEKYPTRTVEHMLAWMILVWSASVAVPGNMMRGPTYQYLLAIAGEGFWGWTGVGLGVLRLVALYINGNWRRTPVLRFVGAMSGLVWWLILSALYGLAVQNGAPDFPMRYVLVVFIFFEAYSCYRCGQDHASPSARDSGNGG
ncbi:hypothetical protein [Bradyrhizobium sp. WU425]|uniref:hypothetical protein n=1 Tax=Bradyrhizobium sp. WU425 TaxID=187029 RepID=UPI001E346D61|nr:hypothetical protein [Bradyrhizobium canariense]UFW75219.1 hypothetical protein BcanWU425_16190 [Bradyrhizobium canariense]